MARRRLKELQILASGDDEDAGYWKGHCYYYAKNCKTKNVSLAVKCWIKAAAEGSAKAKYWLGRCHENGYGMEKNEERADFLYRQALEQIKEEALHGDAESQHIYGDYWHHGKGGIGKQDYTLSYYWFRQSASQGNVSGINDEGYSYQHGLGITKDPSRALAYYRRAARYGYSDPQYNLGWCYQYGCGLAEDMARAVRWYKKAAKQGLPIAQTALGQCYHQGTGVKQNFPKAVELYRQAAEQGHFMAYNDLGWCYQYGEGVAKDYGEALGCYRKAAQYGMPEAKNNMGWCYQNGLGVAEDFEKAVHFYMEAAEQDFRPAQTNLGWCFQHGKGVAKDLRSAVQWYFKGARDDNQSSKELLRDAVQEVKSSIHQDCEGFTRAEAMEVLSYCYAHGAGVIKDADLAKAWAKEARYVATSTNASQKNHGEDCSKCVCCDERMPIALLVHGSSGHACCCMICAHTCQANGLNCPICRCSIDQIALGLDYKCENPMASWCRECHAAPADAAIIHGETSHSGYCFKCANNCQSRKGPCPMCDRAIDRVILQYRV